MKLFSMLLVLLMLCGCGAACADAPEDPVLVRADIGLPEHVTTIWLFDDELMMLESTEDGRRYRELLNVTTGEIVPLTLHENFTHNHTARRKMPSEVALINGEPVEGIQRFGEGSRYVYVNAVADVYYIDWETGIMQSIPSEEVRSFQDAGFTSWDMMYEEYGNDDIRVYSLTGRCCGSFQIDENEHLQAVRPLKNGFLIMTRSDSFSRDLEDPLARVSPMKLYFTDRWLNVWAKKEFDWMSSTDNRDLRCWQSEKTGAILMSDGSLLNPLLITPEWTVHVLVMQEGGLKLVPYEDTEEFALSQDYLYDNVLGVASDSSYALLVWDDNGLYKLDLSTYEITQQMTGEELEALGLGGYRYFGHWPGGEYLNDAGGTLYRLVDRSELNQGM